MTLRRRLPPPPRAFYAGWPTSRIQPIVESDAYRLLRDELEAYLNSIVRGRSFLISGHRGAGKTFLVRSIAENLHYEFFRDADMELRAREGETAPARSSWRYQQRPLMVQIHGPSLLARSNSIADGARQQTAKILAKIMVALYRSVTTEFSTSFAAQGNDLPLRRQAAHMELAAQLQLDLDMGVEPARLREYWRRAGRVTTGVLWPAEIAAARGAGQGVTEIVALTSASQAFRICAGTVTQQQSATDGAKREASAEVKSPDGLKDLSDKLVSLAAGGAVGAAAYHANHIVAAVAGALTALIGSIGLTLSARRNTNSERIMDYKFLPDRSLESLDRDFPLIIQRLRDAGLAPVFVIDELDKVIGRAT